MRAWIVVATLKRGALRAPEWLDPATARHIDELRRVRTLEVQAERDPEIEGQELRRLREWRSAWNRRQAS